jgi:hypothetical protein
MVGCILALRYLWPSLREKIGYPNASSQPVHGARAHTFHEVRVRVHRMRYGSVSEQRLDDLRVLASLEEGRCKGVA